MCICRNESCLIPYGYCHCGCNTKTYISPKTDKQSYRINGEPMRYVKGHDKRITPVVEDALPFKIDGVYCRLIPLTQGQYAIVDAADYKWLMQWKWCAYWDKTTHSYYAARGSSSITESDRQSPYQVYMSREVLNLKKGNNLKADHINHNTLDNRRNNLRTSTQIEQSRNRRITTRNTSGYKGVYYSRTNKNWVAQITIKGKTYHLGVFKTKEDAYAVYCAAARKHFGEFACFQ